MQTRNEFNDALRVLRQSVTLSLSKLRGVIRPEEAESGKLARSALEKANFMTEDARHPGADRTQHILAWPSLTGDKMFILTVTTASTTEYKLYEAVRQGNRIPENAVRLTDGAIAQSVYDSAMDRRQQLLKEGKVRDAERLNFKGG